MLPQLVATFYMIYNHIRFRSGYKTLIADEDMDRKEAKANNGKRFYYMAIDSHSAVIVLTIKEDGDTRTVYNGYVYTIDQFLLIDSLTI